MLLCLFYFFKMRIMLFGVRDFVLSFTLEMRVYRDK